MHKLSGLFKFRYCAPLSKFPFFLSKYAILHWHWSSDHNLDCVDIIIVIDVVLQPAPYSDWNSDTQRVNTTLFTQQNLVQRSGKERRVSEMLIPLLLRCFFCSPVLPTRGFRTVWWLYGCIWGKFSFWETIHLSAQLSKWIAIKALKIN